MAGNFARNRPKSRRESAMAHHTRMSCLLLLLPGLGVSASQADEQQPDTTISRLEFRVMDAGPNAKPVQSFRYSFELYSVQVEEPRQRRDAEYRSEDGILRIPKPYPTFGRAHWITSCRSPAGVWKVRSYQT